MRPLAPLAPTTMISVRLGDAVFKSSDRGSPRRTTFSTVHPTRVRRRAAVDTSRRASRSRSRLSAANSVASTARIEAGRRPIDGERLGSTTASSVTRPSADGWRRLTNPTARLERTEPSSPIRRRRGARTLPLATRTGQCACCTTSRLTLPRRALRRVPRPREPSTMTWARHLRARSTIAFTTGASTTTTSASAHRCLSVRRTRTASRRSQEARAVRARRRQRRGLGTSATITPRARVPSGHGNATVAARAARACGEASVATSTRNERVRIRASEILYLESSRCTIGKLFDVGETTTKRVPRLISL